MILVRGQFVRMARNKANWQFKTADARVKLKRLYPQFG